MTIQNQCKLVSNSLLENINQNHTLAHVC